MTSLDPGLHDALMLSTKHALSLRSRYAILKGDAQAKFFTYVLQLQNGKFYVGNTDNIYLRMYDHLNLTAFSAMWVREHGPVERVVEVAYNSSKEDENYKTLAYMAMFGWQNVRGSSYCRVDMSGPPAALKTFSRARDGAFTYMSLSELESLMALVQEL